MVRIFRELSKLCMFLALWSFPILLAYWNDNKAFLWFFILSMAGTFAVFTHYEDLEKIDNDSDDKTCNENP